MTAITHRTLERVDRRWFMAGALALGACGYRLTPNAYTFRTTDEAREPFFAAIRAFAESQSMELNESETELDSGPFRQFLLRGWRCHVTVSSDMENGTLLPNQFVAYIASTQDSTPWALRGKALEDFAAAFQAALASVPGVEVEPFTFPVSFEP